MFGRTVGRPKASVNCSIFASASRNRASLSAPAIRRIPAPGSFIVDGRSNVTPPIAQATATTAPAEIHKRLSIDMYCTCRYGRSCIPSHMP